MFNKKFILLLFILLFNCFLVKSQKSDLTSLDKKKVINLILERISNHPENYPIKLYIKLGGSNFSNNLSCRDENEISKFVNDSLQLKTQPSDFRYFNNLEEINPKLLDSKYNVKIVQKVNSSIKNVVHISIPKFFNHNKNCFISYEYGDYEFGNLILSKEYEKWKVKFVICESSISY